jgi:L-fuculose-phosphate aldolase
MKLISQKEAEEWVATGAKEFRYNRDVRLTPMARDVLIGAGVKITFDEGAPAPAVTPSVAPAPASAAGVEASRLALFTNDEARRVKEEICDIGRRLWAREYVDGNGGNISCRVGPNEVICTPTGVSKGFLKPEMLCMVDLEGNQLAGTWKRTSEITTHLAIYKFTPEAKSVVHAHPVHATAFAMAGFEPPPCLIPEIEVFVGRVPLAPYATPGSPEMAKVIGPMAPKHQSIMMGNHGIICWGTSVEDAYFKMEITDAYCRTLVVATHIPTSGSTIPSDKMKELLEMKRKMGLPDPRHGLQPVQLCEVDPWEAMKDRPCGCSSKAEAGADYGKMTNAELENMVQEITQQIVNKTSGK